MERFAEGLRTVANLNKRFEKWQEDGYFEHIFDELAKEADHQDYSIDGTYIKTHKAGAGTKREWEIHTPKAEGIEEMVKKRCVGVSRGVRNTKIHAIDTYRHRVIDDFCKQVL